MFWSVAENYGFLNSFDKAAGERKKLGRVSGLKLEQYSMLKGGRGYETELEDVHMNPQNQMLIVW